MTEPRVGDRPTRSRNARVAFQEDYLRTEQQFRHEEARAITRLASRAQTFAFTLATLFLSAGTVAVLTGHEIAGAAIAATASVSLATAFLAGSAHRKTSSGSSAEIASVPTQPTAADVDAESP
jgi:hypothetical protein